MRNVACVVLVGAFGIMCADSTPPTTAPSTSQHTADSVTSEPGVQPEGFETGRVRVLNRGAVTTVIDVWLAETPDQWARGLTGVTDLGDADGMAFVFDVAAEYRFYMWQTPMPLDIAFFDAGGRFVGQATMEPCLDAPSEQCERYSPDVPFLTAIEVPAGNLDDLDLAAGTRIEIASLTSAAPGVE